MCITSPTTDYKILFGGQARGRNIRIGRGCFAPTFSDSVASVAKKAHSMPDWDNGGYAFYSMDSSFFWSTNFEDELIMPLQNMLWIENALSALYGIR